ncbi:response regulator [Cohnella sp. AR92]|uniref:response regulator n=1 Tax=Cohnella sp. AR92 TaxID=648716 RepID=UPI000F8E89B3|nr:response regulator [Cohnella sp. AR92]RUS42647.1 response regulator [Cohnella sp. AR92]
MTKLLIVDDEQIEREGLQAILAKGIPDLIIEQAKNGKLAVQLAEDFEPDLVLMDIMMPGMSGLEAIEIIRSKDPNVKFIMVTAYDTFDYARQAIKLGVIDYLLKPSKASDIVATVRKALGTIEEERATQETNKLQRDALQKVLPVVETDIVTQLLFDHVHEVHSDELVSLLGVSTSNGKFAINVLLPAGLESMYSAVKSKIRQMGSGWVGAMHGRQIPIIVFRDPAQSYRTQAMKIAMDLLALTRPSGGAVGGRERAGAETGAGTGLGLGMESGLQAGVGAGTGNGWFIGIGNVCETLGQIRQSYQEALIASMDSSLPVKYRFFSDTPVLGVTRDGYSARLLEKQFFDRIRLGEWEQMCADVVEFIRRYENEGADLLQAQQRVLELLWIASRALLGMGVETDSPMYSFQAQDYRQLRSETGFLLDRMRQSFEEYQDRLEPDTIQQIKQYIIEHSHKDISLDAIGKRVGLSPFYISKMFKDQLGVNYIDFLTECRIEKAKQLMGDPERSLKEITFEVGYRDPNYFSKVFKKMCDVSPTEYRKTLLGRKG